MEKVHQEFNGEIEEKPNIAEIAADYVETYYQLTVLNLNQKMADISAATSFTMLSALVCSFIAMFLCIAGALWLGGLLGSTALGFLLVSGFCLLVFIILFFTRKKLFYPFVKNMIIKSIYE